jgi:hypothetical protein
MKQKENSRWFFYCEPCGFKKVVEGPEHGMTEIKTSPIPLGVPRQDPKKYTKTEMEDKGWGNRKFWNSNNQKQNTRVKCPKCGRGVTAKALTKTYDEAYKKIDDRKKAEHDLKLKKERLLDGMPDKKRTAFEQQFEKLVGRYLPKNAPSKGNIQEFEKMIDALANKKEKDGSDESKKSVNPRHQAGPSGPEVSGESS